MKLIDLLVKELPRLGGWPKDADSVMQDGFGELYYRSFSSPDGVVYTKIKLQLADDYHYVEISHNKYRQALNKSCAPKASDPCEIRYKNGGQWVRFDMVHVDHLGFFGYFDDNPFAGRVSDYEIRSFKKEREEAIHEIRNVLVKFGNSTITEIAERIYDAGYRKQK